MSSLKWAKHAAPFVKVAMKLAMKKALKTWKGKREANKAEKARMVKLRKQREECNAKLRVMKERLK